MKCFQKFINVNLPILKKKNFWLENFISYRNEHPVFIFSLVILNNTYLRFKFRVVIELNF